MDRSRNLPLQVALWAALLLAAGIDHALALEFDPDIEKARRDIVNADLALIQGLRIESPSPLFENFFGARASGPELIGWFRRRIQKIGSGCFDDTAIACVDFNKDPTKLKLGEQFMEGTQPAVVRTHVYIHEARHSERDNGFWLHARCPRPFVDAKGLPIVSLWSGAPLAGKPSCDAVLQGSYGVGITYLAAIARRCPSCTEKMRQDALVYATDSLQRILSGEHHQTLARELQ